MDRVSWDQSWDESWDENKKICAVITVKYHNTYPHNPVPTWQGFVVGMGVKITCLHRHQLGQIIQKPIEKLGVHHLCFGPITPIVYLQDQTSVDRVMRRCVCW